MPADRTRSAQSRAKNGKVDSSFAQLLPAIHDKAQGIFLGLAIGDAAGSSREDARRNIGGRVDDCPGLVKPGEWTAPTATALALGSSLVKMNAFDPIHAMRKFCAWQEKGAFSHNRRCMGLSPGMETALQRFRETGKPFAGPAEVGNADNGALLRVAPAVIAEILDIRNAEELAGRQSRLTHIAPESVMACEVLARLTHYAVAGAERQVLFRSWEGDWPDGLAQVMRMEFLNWPRHKIVTSNGAVDTLRAALWAVARARSFAEAVALAADFGEYSPATAAVAGQLAGAICGVAGIPQPLLAKLVWRRRIESLTDQLFDQALLRKFN